ncbi:ABC transporter ATP-binding protein [Bacillus ndiopicus]|uniref:ABC transporter ATP-binding protein n=1 Tax=Bacillus ndiopicus TaxID=1347368 RepID=UPI0005A99BAC|nr:dipeptide ABC transporter ATP-binding protein [Bacillus ndiopicus]
MKIEDHEVILKVNDLKKYYPMKKNKAGSTVVKAVDNVNFHIKKGETLGIVGESGCGKSTLAKVIIQLLEATEGDILLEGIPLTDCKGTKLKEIRRSMQMIFQDPYASLNPRWTVERTLLEPLIVHKIGTKDERKKIIKNIMRDVGLDESYLSRYPHEFSGGQRQRIGIARALVLNPKLIIADEPVSALDISVQAQILNLLKDLQEEYDLTYMFITHDLSVVQYIADRIMVMYLGRIVEIGSTETIFSKPLHPYTEALISAVPQVTEEKSKERIIIKGDLPSPTSPPTGCHFHTRCPFVMDKCKIERPELHFTNESRAVACHLHSLQ